MVHGVMGVLMGDLVLSYALNKSITVHLSMGQIHRLKQFSLILIETILMGETAIEKLADMNVNRVKVNLVSRRTFYAITSIKGFTSSKYGR